jgi:type IV pilus assembly protein PilC
MPAFEYQVKDKAGKDQVGVQEAPDVSTLVSSLRSQGFMIIRVNETKKAKTFSVSKGPSKKNVGKPGKIIIDDLVVFSRQMATLVGAGIPLIQALDILSQQMDKEKFRKILADMHQQVQGGRSFSDAMEKHQTVFSVQFCSLT